MAASRFRTLTACVVGLTTLTLGCALALEDPAARGGPRRGGDDQRRREESRRDERRGVGGVGITLYADPNFRGDNANFREDVPDLREFNMNDKADSLQLGRGETWEACENVFFKGRCQVFSSDVADLRRVSWGGKISSLRRVRDGGRRR